MAQQSMTPYSKNSLSSKEELDARKRTIFEMIPQFRKALPDFFSPDRFARICCNLLVAKDGKDLSRVNALLSCSPNTFFGALLGCAQLGLEPDGLLGQAYLIPYGNQIQLIIGYRGLIDLARRSGDLTSLIAHSIHENDTFSFDFGTCELPHHTFSLQQPRGEVIAFYAIARFKDGSYHFDLMTKGEVDAIRSRSKAGNSGPWVTDYEEMGKKTVIRRIAKYLPMCVQRACAYDGNSVNVDREGEVALSPETITVSTETTDKFEDARQQLLEETPEPEEKNNISEKPAKPLPQQPKRTRTTSQSVAPPVAPVETKKPLQANSAPQQERDFEYYKRAIEEAQSSVQLKSLQRQFSEDCENDVFDDGEYITIDQMFMSKEEFFQANSIQKG